MVRDRSDDGSCVREIAEHCRCAVRRQLFGGVPTRCDPNCTCTNVSSAFDVRRRVADHDDVFSGNVDPEHLARATLCDRRELGPILMVGTKCANEKDIGIDADRLELCVRSFNEISSQ